MIADANVTGIKIANDAVTTAKIANANVTTAKIADANVTTAKILDANVTTAKIADANITNAKLDKTNIPLSGFAPAAAAVALGNNKLTGVADPTDAQDAATKKYVDDATTAINTLADGKIYLGNASNQAAEVTMTGDVTINNAGVSTIGTSKVITTMIADANVTGIKIANDAVTTAKIANANVTTAKIADANVTTVKILDANVTTAKIADDAVTVAKIGTAGATDANKLLATDTSGNPKWASASFFYLIGEIKQTIGVMPAGWVMLNGQVLTSLTSTQQTQAANLGFTGYLPNATGAYLSQTGSVLGSVSSANTKTIAQNNLPNVSPTVTINVNSAGTPSGSVTVGNTTSTMKNDGDHYHELNMVSKDNGDFTNANSQYPTGDAGKGNGTNHNVATESSGSHSHTMNPHNHTASFEGNTLGAHGHNGTVSSINGNVTQQPLDITPKTLSVKTFIYLGE